MNLAIVISRGSLRDPFPDSIPTKENDRDECRIVATNSLFEIETAATRLISRYRFYRRRHRDSRVSFKWS